MFCPICGLEDKQSNQFCRACGADLRPVRTALARPDHITESAATARDEIGRAVAAKIREVDSARGLAKVAEDVLPQIEKFLESPAEKRLRRMRTGTIISSIGFGTALALALVSAAIRSDDLLFLAGLGMITFFIGLGFVLNAFFFSLPRKTLADKSVEAQTQRETDSTATQTNDLKLPKSNQAFTSVTEHTTRHLKEKQPAPRS